MQFFPLLLRQGSIGAVGAAHPGIDLVLDTVVIGRTEEQFAHKRLSIYSRTQDSLRQSASSRRNGSTSVTRPMDCKGWCSTTRSTAAGSMSTQTVFAAGASMLATASECWTVASIIT